MSTAIVSSPKATVSTTAKATVLVITVIAMVLAVYSSNSLVGLLLIGYAGVAQFFPGVVLGLYSRRITTAGVFGGLTCGVGIVAFLVLTKRDPFMGWNAGFIGLCCNFAVAAAVSLLSSAGERGFEEHLPQAISE